MTSDFDEYKPAIPFLDEIKSINRQFRALETLYRNLSKEGPECLRDMWMELAKGIDATLHDASMNYVIQKIEEAADA